MRSWAARTWRIAWRTTLVLALLGGGFIWWMNRDTSWNAAQAFAAPGSVREARVGVLITAIAQPSRYEARFWQAATDKILSKVVPWPVSAFARADRGVVLMDPARAYAPKAFAPISLAGIDGGTRAPDGRPWIDLAREGDVEWVSPNSAIPNDTGYFLWNGSRQGMPTVAAKTAAKARYIYYAALEDGYLPHGDQTRALARDTLAALRAAHPQIVATGFANVFDREEIRREVNRILDSGVEVLVLGSGQAIYSDFEELRGSFSDIHSFTQEWRAKNGNKAIRIAVAPYMATEPAFDALWIAHLAATTPSATAPGQSAIAIVALHGLPVSLSAKDSWTPRWQLLAKRIEPKMAAVLRAKGYANVRTATAYEAFADRIEDPKNKLMSVNELYRAARARKFQLAIALPVEFLAENTDTLFAHQASFFEGIAGYRTFSGPPKGTDWSQPYVRTLQDGATTIVYAGAAGGAAQPRASAILATAIGKVFPPR